MLAVGHELFDFERVDRKPFGYLLREMNRGSANIGYGSADEIVLSFDFDQGRIEARDLDGRTGQRSRQGRK